MNTQLIHAAAGKAIAAVAELPLSPDEQYAALVSAASTVYQAVEAHKKATFFDRMLNSIRGGGR